MAHNFANIDWVLRKDSNAQPEHLTSLSALLAVLMDIRAELREIREILYCRPPDTTADNVRSIREHQPTNSKGE
jgi:hypothetical protein